MHIRRGIVTPWVLGTALTFVARVALADEDDRLRQVAGAYLYATDVVDQFKHSRCGRVVTIKTEGFERTIDDIGRYVPENDLAELKAFLKSDDLRNARRDNQKLFEEWYQSFASTDLDEKAKCETIGTSVTNVYEYAKKKWDHAKRTYAKKKK
jgi:hypothetical protein